MAVRWDIKNALLLQCLTSFCVSQKVTSMCTSPLTTDPYISGSWGNYALQMRKKIIENLKLHIENTVCNVLVGDNGIFRDKTQMLYDWVNIKYIAGVVAADFSKRFLKNDKTSCMFFTKSMFCDLGTI